MKKVLLILIPLFIIAVGLFLGKDLILEKLTTKGELKVESQSDAAVFVNGENKGKAPITEKIKSGEYEVKIVPNESSLFTFNQKVKVSPGTQTFISYFPGTDEKTSSWDIMSLEKMKGSDTEVRIDSAIAAAEVFIDGEKKGTTPLSFQNVKAGDHELRISLSGYFDNPLKINVTEGFQLAINSHLAQTAETAKNDNKTETKKEDTKTTAKEMVLIKDTPTGFLRVRNEASTSAEEVGRVTPGEKYALVEEKTDWLKIEYETGKDGWVSGKYAEKVK